MLGRPSTGPVATAQLDEAMTVDEVVLDDVHLDRLNEPA
jgi:hypothetical protein